MFTRIILSWHEHILLLCSENMILNYSHIDFSLFLIKGIWYSRWKYLWRRIPLTGLVSGSHMIAHINTHMQTPYIPNRSCQWHANTKGPRVERRPAASLHPRRARSFRVNWEVVCHTCTLTSAYKPLAPPPPTFRRQCSVHPASW